MTTVRPFTTCVVVVTVAPDPPDVVTAPPTCGALAVCVPAAFVLLDVAAVVLAGKECVASATAAAPVPARSAAAVQFDMRLTRLIPSLRDCLAPARTSGPPGPAGSAGS